jgi:muramoyltetrapeptide carboxypeptidase
MGIFNKVCGVLVGYIDSMQRSNQPRPWMEDILLEVTQQYAFPIMKINDFGHNCPNTILPVGGEVSMNADKHTLEIISPCVRHARG